MSGATSNIPASCMQYSRRIISEDISCQGNSGRFHTQLWGYVLCPAIDPSDQLAKAAGTSASLGFQSRQKRLQSGSIEFPIEWARLTVRQFLVQPQTQFDLLQAGKVIRGQYLPLNDREVDLHLVQPAGRTTLSRSAPRTGPRLGLAARPKRPNTAKPTSLVLVFDSHRSPRAGRQRRMAADTGLDACLLVRTDDVVLAAQRLVLPGTVIQVQDSSCFLGEARIAGEDPVLIPPRLDRVGVENSPDRAGTDGSADSSRDSCGEVRGGQSTQGELSLADSLAGNGLDDGLVTRGKNRAFARVLPDRPRKSRLEPTANARGERSWGATPRRPPPRRWIRPVIRGAGEPTAPFGIEQAKWFADERDSDIVRGIQPEMLVDRKVQAQP